METNNGVKLSEEIILIREILSNKPPMKDICFFKRLKKYINLYTKEEWRSDLTELTPPVVNQAAQIPDDQKDCLNPQYYEILSELVDENANKKPMKVKRPKPKKKVKVDKPSGLENFMEKKSEDSNNN